MARILRPWQDLVRDRLHELEPEMSDEARRLAWFHLTCSYNSDGQWPPTLPDAPHIVHPFNYRYCFEHLLKAEEVVGGVYRSALETDPLATLEDILGPQQELVLAKAAELEASGEAEQVERARRARALIAQSREVSALRDPALRVLYPSEYATRAEALVEARRLVGGVLIEKVDTDFGET